MTPSAAVELPEDVAQELAAACAEIRAAHPIEADGARNLERAIWAAEDQIQSMHLWVG